MSARSSQILVKVPSAGGGPGAERLVEASELGGWLPVDAVVEDGRPLIRWLDVRGARLSESFFQQTIERLTRAGAGELFTDFEALIQLEKVADFVRPAGFIFHASRCGSTLVSNACRALDGAVVVSEAPSVDKLVWDYLVRDDGARALLRRVFMRAVVHLLGQRRLGDERRLFVKFSCCSTLRLAFVRSIWQDVPWLFIHRDPVEIIVSNVRTVPEWLRFESHPEQAAALTGLPAEEAPRLSLEEACARSLGRFFDAAAAGAEDARGMLVGYEELSDTKLFEIVRFFGADPTAGEAERINATARLYAKDAVPARPFAPDGAAKRAAASPHAREMAQRWAAEPYRRLRAKSSSQ
jgi:hypothetical protein